MIFIFQKYVWSSLCLMNRDLHIMGNLWRKLTLVLLNYAQHTMCLTVRKNMYFAPLDNNKKRLSYLVSSPQSKWNVEHFLQVTATIMKTLSVTFAMLLSGYVIIFVYMRMRRKFSSVCTMYYCKLSNLAFSFPLNASVFFIWQIGPS